MRARERRTDLVPIRPTIDRHEDNVGRLLADIIGTMGDDLYKYALVLSDVQSRYVTAFELTAPSAKNVVDKIIFHSSYFGVPRFYRLIVKRISQASQRKFVWRYFGSHHDFIVRTIQELRQSWNVATRQ
jgi:hypothetical protein